MPELRRFFEESPPFPSEDLAFWGGRALLVKRGPGDPSDGGFDLFKTVDGKALRRGAQALSGRPGRWWSTTPWR
jgi:hypothetical protein